MIETLFSPLHSLDESIITQVRVPEDSLGRLSDIVIKLASHQKTATPHIKQPWISVFAANQAGQSIQNGHSALNRLAQQQAIPIDLVHIDLENETPNGVQAPAMSKAELIEAMSHGIQAAERAKAAGSDLLITGEASASNTASAIAMVAVLSGKPVEELMSLGRERLMRSQKAEAELIQATIELHQAHLSSPLQILQHLGDLEAAALCGAYIRAAQLGMTFVVDSFMGAVAFWVADMISRNDQLVDCDTLDEFMDLGKYSVPETMFCLCGTCTRLVEWSFFAQISDNPIHGWVLETLAVEPLLSLNLNIGQATGATLSLSLIQQACDIHNPLSKSN